MDIIFELHAATAVLLKIILWFSWMFSININNKTICGGAKLKNVK